MPENPWPRIALVLVALIILIWGLSSLTPAASSGLENTVKIGAGAAFIGWIVYLALTANRRRR